MARQQAHHLTHAQDVDLDGHRHGNERGRRFYERAGGRLVEVIAEPVEGAGHREFWAMRKELPPRDPFVRSG